MYFRSVRKSGIVNSRFMLFLRDNSGIAQPALGLFVLLFVLVMMIFILNVAAYKAASDKLEDALAASGLAASLIDTKQYGIDHSLIITEPENVYEKYKETLMINLNLKDSFPRNTGIISGPVKVEDFRIYNVRNKVVTEIEVSESGVRNLGSRPLGQMKAPNGQVIELTGIYSEISFPINNRYGKNIFARKSKLTSVNTF